MTDAMAVQTAKLFGNEMPKLGVLNFNRYGNISNLRRSVHFVIIATVRERRPR